MATSMLIYNHSHQRHASFDSTAAILIAAQHVAINQIVAPPVDKTSQHDACYRLRKVAPPIDVILKPQNIMASNIVKILNEALAKRMKVESFDRLLSNMKFVTAGDGHILCEIKVDDRHRNMHGTVHGGMICTLIDVVTSFALLTKNRRGVSVDLNVSFIKPAEIGQTIEIDGKVLKLGKHMAFANAEVRHKDTKKILAAGRQSLFITHQNIKFLSAAKLGSDLQIDGKVVKVGKHLAFLSANVRDKTTNQILAEGRHTKYITE